MGFKHCCKRTSRTGPPTLPQHIIPGAGQGVGQAARRLANCRSNLRFLPPRSAIIFSADIRWTS